MAKPYENLIKSTHSLRIESYYTQTNIEEPK